LLNKSLKIGSTVKPLSYKKVKTHFYSRNILLLILFTFCTRFALFMGVKPWHDEVIQERIITINSDAMGYHLLAISLLEHQRFEIEGHPEALRTPGYPLFICGIYRIFGIRPWVVLLAQIILEMLSCALLYFNISRMLNSRIAFFSCLFYALDPVLILHSVLLMSEILFVFFCILGFTFFCRAFQNLSLRKSIFFYSLSGLCWGLATLVRPISAYIGLIFVLGLFFLYRKQIKIGLRYAVIWALVFFVTLSPWFLRNYKTFGHFSFSTSGAYNLLALYTTPMEAQKRKQEPRLVRVSLFSEAEEWMRKDGHDPNALNPFEKAKYWKRLAFWYISSDLMVFVKSYFLGIVHTFINVGTGGYAPLLGFSWTYFDMKAYSNIFDLAKAFLKTKTIQELLITGFISIFFLISYVGLILGLLKSCQNHLTQNLLWVNFAIAIYFIGIPGPAGLCRFKLPAIPFYLPFVGIWITSENL